MTKQNVLEKNNVLKVQKLFYSQAESKPKPRTWGLWLKGRGQVEPSEHMWFKIKNPLRQLRVSLF
jgi:hypothetical protein